MPHFPRLKVERSGSQLIVFSLGFPALYAYILSGSSSGAQSATDERLARRIIFSAGSWGWVVIMREGCLQKAYIFGSIKGKMWSVVSVSFEETDYLQ